MRSRGFGLLGLVFWLAVLGGLGWVGYKLIPPYYTYWKVQDLFEDVAGHLSDQDAATIERRLPELMEVKYIDRNELPPAFWENLEIEADGERVRIRSSYDVVVWLLGPVQDVDDPEDYDPNELHGLDVLRDRLKFVFHFAPHAETQ